MEMTLIRRIRLFFLTAALLVAFLPFRAAVARSFEDGISAYSHGDYASAFGLWRPLAEHGDAWAQMKLGEMYYDGRGIAQDDDAAATWYAKSAEQGVSESEYALGSMYETGRGVQKNDRKAIYWIQKAALQGHDEAQSRLGAKYEEGDGVRRDYMKAYFWMLLANSTGSHELIALDQVKARLTQKQITSVERRAQNWKPKPSPIELTNPFRR